jgi:tetratricopeptide (TPR) repeat protein
LIGESLGPFRLIRELGSGGMGKVYAATLEREAVGLEPGATVAVKVVHPHLLETEGFFKRFLREAHVGQSVQHDNVVRTLDCDALGDHHFLVMEYVEGQTLRELLDELGTVPEELCRHVAREICKGLGAVHGAGAIHRDLKPENVLITADHVVKVMDLGVARLVDESMRLSQTGAFVGSVHYAAPEQFHDRGRGVDHRVDLHALGLLLYELACGAHPYLADDFASVLHRILDEEPARIGSLEPQLSPFFEELVHTLLAKDPGGRFVDAGAVLDALESGEDGPWWAQRSNAIRTATQRPLRRIRIPRETAVYGRDREIEQLRSCFGRVVAGEGQVVLLEGEAGIGKSRLVDELVARLSADGEDVDFLFGSYPPAGAATAHGALAAAFHEHLGDAGAAEHLASTPLLVPAFDALLRGEPAPADARALDDGSIATCFVGALRGIAEGRPTILLVDDLHFAPQEARKLFMALALAVPGHRVLLVGTTRPGLPETWVAHLTRLEQVQTMSLGRLSPKDLALLLKETLRSERLAEDLGFKVALKSDGNPFFAFEIIRGLREGQFITRHEDGTWGSTRVIDDIEIPSSVLDLVNARVADLDESQRDLLDVASCLGFEFDPALLAEATGMPRVACLKTLAQIERKHRLVRAAGRRFVFDHHQVQEALYGALPEMLREEYHAALGDALERMTDAGEREPEDVDGDVCVALCTHFLRGARGERAMCYFGPARLHLRAAHSYALHVDLAQRALAVPGLVSGDERAWELMRLGGVRGSLTRLGRNEAAVDACEEAARWAEDSQDARLRGWSANALGAAYLRVGRHDDAKDALKRAITRAGEAELPNLGPAACANLGLMAYREGRLDEARTYHERDLRGSEAIDDANGVIRAHINLGLVERTEGNPDAALDHLRLAEHLALQRGNESHRIDVAHHLGGTLGEIGRFEEAERQYTTALTLSRAIGNRATEGLALGGLGDVYGARGQLADAKELLRGDLAICREIDDRFGEARALNNLGSVLYTEGRLDENREHMRAYVELSRDLGYRRGEAIGLGNLGSHALVTGDAQRAVRLLQASLALAREIQLVRTEGLVGVWLAAALEELGDLDGAREALMVARAAADRTAHPESRVLSRCRLAVLGGDADEAGRVLDEHADGMDAMDRREAHWLLWRATGEEDHLEVAKRLLDEALAGVPEESRQSMLANLPVNRDIQSAWLSQSASGGDPDDDTSERDTLAAR